uniref:Peptidase A9 domain-containing protein n=1 Tax=Biomphalaria glabrata TaxID=6526 RepID=A0A2C9KYW7_BIOGL
MEIPLLEEDMGDGQVRKILLVEDTTIPAQSECIIFGKVEGHCKTISTKLGETAKGTENILSVGKTLVISVGDRKVPERVMNLYSQENKLRAGSVIADCYSVDLITQCRDAEGSTNTVAKESAQIHKILTKMEENLSMEEYNKSEKLILEFMDIMPNDENDCGRTNLVQHSIDTGNARPIRKPSRRLQLAKQQEALDMLERMKQQEVIKPSNSPWCSPVVLVKKKDGT